MQTRWHVLENTTAVERAATARILDAAGRAIAARGAFHLVLAGGNTPRRIYHALRAAPADWLCWHAWFGDERCLSPAAAERNSRMAAEAWLDHVPIPAGQVHVIPAELGAEAAATRYESVLAGVGPFDLVLLGLGEDGHTASLFPGHPLGEAASAPAVLAISGAPKPPSARVSLSARRLAATRELLFLVSGEGKREAVMKWRAGEAIPAAAIAPAAGVDILIDFALPSDDHGL